MAKRKKTEFGADREADRILEDIPRLSRARDGVGKGDAAVVYINDSGSLVILLKEGGALVIKERDLVKVHGDEIV